MTSSTDKQVTVFCAHRAWANPTTKQWELHGICTDKSKAEAEAKRIQGFVGPIILDNPVPDQRTVWPVSSWPR